MKFLLDTNVISQMTKPKPDETVLRWMMLRNTDSLCISSISIFELTAGLALMDSGKRKQSLRTWLEQDVMQEFAGRILPVDEAVSAEAGRLFGRLKADGVNNIEMDCLIAATASVHQLTVATLDNKDFKRFGVALVDFNAA